MMAIKFPAGYLRSTMTKLKFLVSLWMQENPYQRCHAAAAEEAGRRLGIDVKILYAKNDPMTQVEQLLSAIQGPPSSRPDGIICAPVGTTLTQVARQAAAAGIGWVLLNRDGDYLEQLRSEYSTPSFCVAVDQEHIGTLQAQQFSALLPEGGMVLYILGPQGNMASQRRLNAMQTAKAANIQVRTIPANWSEQGGYKAITSWLQVSSSVKAPVGLVAGQNDDIALGARKAFQELPHGIDRERWINLPFIGVDCCPGAGEEWIRKGLLTASVVNPPSAGVAVEMLAHALEMKTQPAEYTRLAPQSYPSIEKLQGMARGSLV